MAIKRTNFHHCSGYCTSPTDNEQSLLEGHSLLFVYLQSCRIYWSDPNPKSKNRNWLNFIFNKWQICLVKWCITMVYCSFNKGENCSKHSGTTVLHKLWLSRVKEMQHEGKKEFINALCYQIIQKVAKEDLEGKKNWVIYSLKTSQTYWGQISFAVKGSLTSKCPQRYQQILALSMMCVFSFLK